MSLVQSVLLIVGAVLVFGTDWMKKRKPEKINQWLLLKAIGLLVIAVDFVLIFELL